MPLLQLPTSVELRPKSVEILRQVGVQIVQSTDGYGFNFPEGVAQVVACVLETEKNLAANSGTLDQWSPAIACAERRV
ncbi:MAG: hypothetical protein ABIZ81_14255 [Opitutaceae bacterium]